MKNKLIKRSKVGSTMLFAVLVMTFILIAGLTVAQLVFIEQRLVVSFSDSQKAYYAAETGIEYAVSDSSCFPEITKVWLDEDETLGFNLGFDEGFFYSVGISKGVKRKILFSMDSKIDLIINSGEEVLINDLPSKYACMNASYALLDQDATSGSSIIKVSDIRGFSPGDSVLIAQMKNLMDDGYDKIIDSSGAQYEDRIVSINFNEKEIEIGGKLPRDFSFGTTQVISIKNFRSIIITGGSVLKAPSYDPLSGIGGVLALRSEQAIRVDGGSKISMTDHGYPGVSDEGDSSYIYANGNGPGGGGGGASGCNTGLGGAGGGSAGTGGSTNSSINPPINGTSCPAGYVMDYVAQGGSSYGVSSSLNTLISKPLFMGSAGGSGGSPSEFYPGASGGGVIRLKALRFELEGIIESRGGDAINIDELQSNCPGGGGGGSVYLIGGGIIDASKIFVNGGNGADRCSLGSTASSGGGGGRIIVHGRLIIPATEANYLGGKSEYDTFANSGSSGYFKHLRFY